MQIRASLFAFLIVLSLSLSLETAAADSVREVQERLSAKGYDPGPIDGLMGPSTRRAIREFQKANGLAVTGRLDARTQSALGVSLQAVEIPAGTRIQVRLDDRLDSGRSRTGDTFTMTVSEGVAVGDQVAIPRGAVISGRVAEVEKAQRPQKAGKLVLEAERVRIQGNSYPLRGEVTGDLEGEGSLKQDLKKIGIGAGAGAVIGGLLGGKKGALAGVLIGGGGTFLGTKGEEVELASETPLIVELRSSTTVAAQ